MAPKPKQQKLPGFSDPQLDEIEGLCDELREADEARKGYAAKVKEIKQLLAERFAERGSLEPLKVRGHLITPVVKVKIETMAAEDEEDEKSKSEPKGTAA